MNRPPVTIFAQLTLLSRDVETATPKQRYERPMLRGMKTGCTTERVLLALFASSPKPLTHGELKSATHARRGAISWALLYLKDKGWIESNETMRAHYLRYRLTALGTEKSKRLLGIGASPQMALFPHADPVAPAPTKTRKEHSDGEMCFIKLKVTRANARELAQLGGAGWILACIEKAKEIGK